MKISKLALILILGVMTILVALLPEFKAARADEARVAQPLHVMLDSGSRARLAEAYGRDLKNLMLEMVSRPGENLAVVKAVQAAGGEVRYRDDDVGYVRALTPVVAVDSLIDAAPLEGVAVDVIEVTGPPKRMQQTGQAYRRQSAPSAPAEASDGAGAAPAPLLAETVDRAWPLAHPYDPLPDMGAFELRRKHPTYDGRDVTIGHVEFSPDLLAPELQAALTLDGRPIRKIVDVYGTFEPYLPYGEMGGLHWILMREHVSAAANRRFSIGGLTYVAPRPGEFRFGVVEDRDVCRRLNCPIAVLWDKATGEVWLDTNSDRDFANERALRDYRVRQEVGVIGQDDPSTREQQRFSFVVQTRPTEERVAILFGTVAHTTMTASSAAGSRGTRGRFDGIAPGAQLLEVAATQSIGGAVEALIAAFKDPRADLVFSEDAANSLAFDYQPHDGRYLGAVMAQRLMARYKKPYAGAAGNAPYTAHTSEEGNAPYGFVVGASQGRESYRINDGVLVQYDDNLHQVGTWGPGGDGSIKPTILSPSHFIAGWVNTPGFMDAGIKEGWYTLPKGYVIGGGTSQATPAFAGALALLLSAAKQEKVPYDQESIWRAVTNSARFVPHLAAYKQGNGIVDVAAAYELLKAYAAHPPTIHIVSRGPVHTPYSARLATPNEGVSLFETEGWRAGMRATRTLTLTRTSGPEEPMTFTLSWLGNAAGTFSSPTSIVLPLGRPIALPIEVAPKSSGVHSALLSLDHPTVPGHVYRLMTTIVVAEQFDAAHQYTVTISDTLQRPGPWYSYFLNVPPGTTTLTVNLTGAESLGVDARPLNVKPAVSSTAQFGSEQLFSWLRMRLHTRIVVYPTPGVWEVFIRLPTDDGPKLRWSGISPGSGIDPSFPIMLTAQISRVETTLTATGPALTAGRCATFMARLRSAAGPFTGHVKSTALGSGRIRSGRISAAELRAHEIEVPPGAELLHVTVTPRDSSGSSVADMDVYLFDCSSGTCERSMTAHANAGSVDSGVLQVWQPRAGRWKVVLDAPHAPAAGVEYELRDVLLDPAVGGAMTNDPPRVHAVGESWQATLNAWMVKAPPTGREPYLAVITEATGDSSGPVPISVLALPVRAGQ